MNTSPINREREGGSQSSSSLPKMANWFGGPREEWTGGGIEM